MGFYKSSDRVQEGLVHASDCAPPGLYSGSFQVLLPELDSAGKPGHDSTCGQRVSQTLIRITRWLLEYMCCWQCQPRPDLNCFAGLAQ